MKNKLISLILASLMIASLVPLFAVSASAAEDVAISADENWYNESATELIIEDEADFIAFLNAISENSSLNDGDSKAIISTVSGTTTFDGVTIKLATDINLNPKWQVGEISETVQPAKPTNTFTFAAQHLLQEDF